MSDWVDDVLGVPSGDDDISRDELRKQFFSNVRNFELKGYTKKEVAALLKNYYRYKCPQFSGLFGFWLDEYCEYEEEE